MSFAASSSNTYTNSFPIIFRFCSGSLTPFSFDRNRSCAFTRIILRPNFPERLSITWSPSPLRSKPWSTKIQMSWSPIAFCKRTPTTLESTPPDSPSKTFLWPTFSRIFAISISIKLSIDQSPVAPQISNTKLRSMSFP